MIDLLDLAERFVSDADDLALLRAEVLAISADGAEGASHFLTACRLIGEGAADPAALVRAVDDLGVSSPADLVGALVMRSFAAVRADYPSRPDAQAARAALSAAGDAAFGPVGDAFGADVHAWLVRLVGEAVVQLSAIAAARAPLVRVETGVSLPSSLIAFDLYEDPDRGTELVARNRVGTPFVMPVLLEALAE